jgi:hypothetical protein
MAWRKLLRLFRPISCIKWANWVIKNGLTLSKRCIASRVRILSRKSTFLFREPGKG